MNSVYENQPATATVISSSGSNSVCISQKINYTLHDSNEVALPCVLAMQNGIDHKQLLDSNYMNDKRCLQMHASIVGTELN